jgi:hypothetical protein
MLNVGVKEGCWSSMLKEDVEGGYWRRMLDGRCWRRMIRWRMLNEDVG